ncbi:hypothetical protein NP493_1071g00028 [Ridgeia piscesae]|uniref:C2 domain-containing protein n=1 Tax=Ridgeia piscesae TaxID=27915 RepID=A0AAD9KHS4_RIDPI|nr:hypothetical protein NP493_1071g00028 [Ridgeia piscesae]
MDNDEDTLQFKHASLPTRQCRLRHLRGIAVRNLTLKGKRPLPGPLTQIQVFFTLHLTLQHPAFYTSTKMTGSLVCRDSISLGHLEQSCSSMFVNVAPESGGMKQSVVSLKQSVNPTWTSVALSAVGKEHNVDLAGKFVVVRVWQGWLDMVSLCIEWLVDLSQLVYLGEKIQREGSHFADNSLVFAMFEGYYGIRPQQVRNEDTCHKEHGHLSQRKWTLVTRKVDTCHKERGHLSRNVVTCHKERGPLSQGTMTLVTRNEDTCHKECRHLSQGMRTLVARNVDTCHKEHGHMSQGMWTHVTRNVDTCHKE